MPPTKNIEEVLKETKIYQILRPKLVMELPSITLQEAVDLMRGEKSGYLIIADEHSKLLGMFTEREVLMNALKKGTDWSAPISQFMRTDLHTLTKSSTVGEALAVMAKFSVRHVPLVDEYGQINGILSIRTIVSFLAELFPKEILNLPPRPQIHETAEGG